MWVEVNINIRKKRFEIVGSLERGVILDASLLGGERDW